MKPFLQGSWHRLHYTAFSYMKREIDLRMFVFFGETLRLSGKPNYNHFPREQTLSVSRNVYWFDFFIITRLYTTLPSAPARPDLRHSKWDVFVFHVNFVWLYAWLIGSLGEVQTRRLSCAEPQLIGISINCGRTYWGVSAHLH